MSQKAVNFCVFFLYTAARRIRIEKKVVEQLLDLLLLCKLPDFLQTSKRSLSATLFFFLLMYPSRETIYTMSERGGIYAE